jgi:zinc transporter ZupT
MDSFLWVLLLSVAMAIGSFLAGSIPLAFRFSEDRLKLLTTFGSGLMVGTALIVILPEGVETLFSVGGGGHSHSHDEQDHDHDSAAEEGVDKFIVGAGGKGNGGGQSKSKLEEDILPAPGGKGWLPHDSTGNSGGSSSNGGGSDAVGSKSDSNRRPAVNMMGDKIGRRSAARTLDDDTSYTTFGDDWKVDESTLKIWKGAKSPQPLASTTNGDKSEDGTIPDLEPVPNNSYKDDEGDNSLRKRTPQGPHNHDNDDIDQEEHDDSINNRPSTAGSRTNPSKVKATVTDPSVSKTKPPENPASYIGISLAFGFVFMFLVDQMSPHAHAHSKSSGGKHHHHGPAKGKSRKQRRGSNSYEMVGVSVTDPSSGSADGEGGTSSADVVTGTDDDDEEQEMIGRDAKSGGAVATAASSGGGSVRMGSATLGLIVHAAADGIALGAASASSRCLLQ